MLRLFLSPARPTPLSHGHMQGTSGSSGTHPSSSTREVPRGRTGGLEATAATARARELEAQLEEVPAEAEAAQRASGEAEAARRAAVETEAVWRAAVEAGAARKAAAEAPATSKAVRMFWRRGMWVRHLRAHSLLPVQQSLYPPSKVN